METRERRATKDTPSLVILVVEFMEPTLGNHSYMFRAEPPPPVPGFEVGKLTGVSSLKIGSRETYTRQERFGKEGGKNDRI